MEQQENKGWKERLRDRYLLVLRNEETFEEMASYKLTLLNLYLVLSTIFVVLFIVVIAIFFLTPLRTLVPGYGVIEEQAAFQELKRDYSLLEDEIAAQETYINSLRRMLTNDPEGITDVMEVDTIEEVFVGPVRRIREDSILRNTVENELVLDNMRITFNDFDQQNQRSIKEIFMTPPVKGEISARFMPENLHYGIDVMAPSNTPILSILDGIVITSDWTLETGNTLAVQHDNNIVSFYKHNSANLKAVGDRVKAGEAVAIIGNTGTLTTGPHLHFELWIDGKAVNPADYVYFR
ncbi:MAG: M23 family metallopeptidase [Saprospiraceae bacterium]|nr:M23 family metallopeptidase [Saprospiraceae bacterium]